MSKVHTAAQQGFSTSAQAYVRGRPEYPAEIVDWLTKELGLGAGKTVIDLGAGTGKFTKLLTKTGATVLAVEPVDAMREQLGTALPAVQTFAGTAQAMPLPDASADAVVCAQAFHWFATTEALAEIHRVLKPGGQLGLVWNVRDESVDWVAALTRLVTPYEGDAPRFYKGDWRKPFDGSFFTPLLETAFPYEHVGSAEDVIVDRFLSVSFIAALPDDQKAHVAAQLRALVAAYPALQGDTVSFPYRTQVYRATRLAD
ncbi:methyltransferase domain-containing protein [Pigmentiphaga aceris]|uniref:Methyltransferase domain-containing protein n=1 Tax=Pigmentiphaga aceris TaxID=1940612 RepID=A0A5C0B1U7_9BURK|nr:class I SAM-dependent methyltransferase [Pigmentiphaga aceris]QEI07130.1 methyltransferase domain-containing protein [Pigmentiphaga aceris]